MNKNLEGRTVNLRHTPITLKKKERERERERERMKERKKERKIGRKKSQYLTLGNAWAFFVQKL